MKTFHLTPISIILIFALDATAFDVSVSGSSSNTSTTSRVSASQKILENQRVSLTYTKTQDTQPLTQDPTANSLKLGYFYKIVKAQQTLRLNLKKADDFYFYEGLGVDAVWSIPLFYSEYDKNIKLETRLSLKIESDNKKYNKNSSEAFRAIGGTVTIEQEMTPHFLFGIEASGYSYSTSGVETQNAFNGKATTLTDVSSTVNNLSKFTGTTFLEYSNDNYSLGASFSSSSAVVESQKGYSNISVFGDYTFFEVATVNVTWTRGRTDGATISSDSIGFGVSFNP